MRSSLITIPVLDEYLPVNSVARNGEQTGCELAACRKLKDCVAKRSMFGVWARASPA